MKTTRKFVNPTIIPVVLSVDEGARFLPLFGQPSPSGSTALAGIAGVQVFEANRTIINALKADGALIVEKSYVHSYPALLALP